jgi:peptide-methionine (R)-S-oxide reductase
VFQSQAPRLIERRGFLFASGAALVGLAYGFYRMESVHAQPEAPLGPPQQVTIVEFADDGERRGIISVLTIQKSEAAWRKQLSAAAFEVTRHAGTEFPFSGALLNVHDKGVFRCICCDTALFDSATKFDSGTGWPSFWAPIAKENIAERTDRSLGMERTAVTCRRCDAHIGHVFEDGPDPTGLRYCMNSVAMRFAKAS